MEFSKILIAVDRSSAAFKAAQIGFTLAESLKTAEVLLIHVIEPTMAMGNPDGGIFPEQALAELRIEGEGFLQQLIEMYGKQVQSFHAVLEGKVSSEILQAAKT